MAKKKKRMKKRAKKIAVRPGFRYGSRLALRDLLLFVLLALISYALYSVSGNEIYQDTFYLLAIVFGFIALAFLIVLLALLFAKGRFKGKKKRR